MTGRDVPPIGPRVRRWYRARVRQILCEPAAKGGCREALPPDLLELLGKSEMQDAVTDWFEEEITRFIEWLPYEHYPGPGFPAGRWEVQLGKVLDWACVVRLCHDRLVAPDLDSWLRADMAHAFLEPGTYEPSAQFLLPAEGMKRLRESRKRLRARRKPPGRRGRPG